MRKYRLNNLTKKFGQKEKRFIFATRYKSVTDSVAQLVEHNTFNVGVLGSSPSRVTKTFYYPHKLSL